MLDISPEVEPIRRLVAGRLLDDKAQKSAQKQLNQMLITLWRGGYVMLEPKPDLGQLKSTEMASDSSNAVSGISQSETATASRALDLGQRRSAPAKSTEKSLGAVADQRESDESETNEYRPVMAQPTDTLADLLKLRGVHPLYGLFLMNHLGIADRTERILAIESLLELPRSLGRAVRIPPPTELPPGPLATTRVDSQLLKLGLATAEELGALPNDEQVEQQRGWYDDDYVPILTLPHKLQRLFQHDFPTVNDLRVFPVWAAGEVLNFGGDFNKYVTSYKLQKQEGMIFRHMLRMILLIDELAMLGPPDIDHQQWQDELGEIADALEASCRQVDSYSTDQWLDEVRG